MPVDITEYQSLAYDSLGNRIAAGVEPARAVQQITQSGVSQQTNIVQDTTRFVRIHTDGPIRIAFGANPTAGPTSQRMAANSTEYFGIAPSGGNNAPTMRIALGGAVTSPARPSWESSGWWKESR